MNSKTASVLFPGTAILAGTAAVSAQAASDEVQQIALDLLSNDDQTRRKALEAAALAGASGVPVFVRMLQSEDTETRRAGQRAIEAVVHHAGRPGAASEAEAVAQALVQFLGDDVKVNARRDVLWFLSEIGGHACVPVISRLLSHAELREDARMVLQRIPGDDSLNALKRAYQTTDREFAKHIAESLTKRGVAVPGFKSEKLKPVKQTGLKPSTA